MESKTNYTIVGIIVLVLAVGLLSAGLWLSIGFDQKKYNIYAVYMGEAASGLNEESLVRYNGVKVGYVNKIELNQADPQQVKIHLKIVEGTPVTQATRATLINQGITGTTYLGLSASSPTLTPLQKKPGELYPVIPYNPSFFHQLEENVNDMSVGMKRILSKQNTTNLSKALANLQTITDVIAVNNASLEKSLRNLPALINELKKGVHQFGAMADELSVAGSQVTSTMKAGRNSIDKISQQALPPAVILLRRLNLIAANLEKTSAEMRQNPAVIIRGSASPKLGPGERK